MGILDKTEKYVQCMGMFTSQLKKKFKIQDLKYFDGYFVLAGKNSIAHFHINECPGWLFGIWLASLDDTGTIEFSFFAQYEEFIDKFKPANSTLVVEGKVYLSYDADSFINSSSFRDCCNLVKYIQNEPALAFCRDQFYYDYNTEYLSREDAESEFRSFIEDSHHADKVINDLNEKCIAYYKSHILPELPEGSYIKYRGEKWSPKYMIMCPISSAKAKVESQGVYALNQFLLPDCRIYLDSYLAQLCKEAEDESVIWFYPIDDVVGVYDDSTKEES